VLSWLLSRQEPLSQINRQRIQKGRRSKFQELDAIESFQMLSFYHRVLYPCVQAIRFFEQDHITVCHVYPAIKTLKAHLAQQEDPEKVDIAECLDYWRAIADLSRLRQRKLLEMDPVKVAFWLILFGCALLAAQRKVIPESHQLRLEYEYPGIVAVHGPLDPMIAEAAPRSGPEFDEGEIADYEFTGDSITEESLGSVPGLHVRRGETLIFIQELLIRFLLEDLPPSQSGGKETSERKDRERPIRGCVETLISLFFCGDQYPARCQDTPAGIDKQVELWNFVSRNAPGWSYDQVVEKIISVTSIPASEASRERSFSRQKRIMGHSRVNSNRDLLRARFQLKEGPSE
jgi:hypothetical protein